MIYAILAALALDFIFSEPKRFHPLVGLGVLAEKVEARLNHSNNSKIGGLIALGVIVFPFWWVAFMLERALESMPATSYALSAIVLYSTIGWKSLLTHAEAVRMPLQGGDLTEARQKVAYIVSRDTASLNSEGVSKAATESILENGNDAIFAALFWFLVGGISGVIVYRIVNTLDAMWGYKNTRFFYFGWAAAKFDDVLNWFPARLCALTYALCGNTQSAIRCWREQAADWKSPSAGPVMASGAGALNVKLGGVAHYMGDSEVRPRLGCGGDANYESIQQAINLINRSLALWVVVLIIGSIILW